MASGDRDTRLVHDGRNPVGHAGAVNIPPYRASTILFPTVAALDASDPDFREVRYGRTGTPSSHAFEEAMAALEGGDRAVSFGSGLQAITTCLLAFLKAGDHLLMVDSCYGPTRAFCRRLGRLGIETTFYDPSIGADIGHLVRPETRVVFLESPGSQTFEVQDVPAITAAAKARGCTVVIDNTWAAGLFFRPLDHGVDVSIQACTKYVAGHADANLGVAVCNRGAFLPVKHMAVELGASAAADDLFLGLRGLRTLPLRLARHQETGFILADWLSRQPEIARVLHPGLPACPGHDLWRRDFSGACGLFAVQFHETLSKAALGALLDHLSLFGLGYSWGGYESLALPCDPRRGRTAVPWQGGSLIRFHAGLESADDLVHDLQAGFDRLRKTLSA